MNGVDWYAVLLGLAAVTWGTLTVFALLAYAMWREERRDRRPYGHPSLTRLDDFGRWEAELNHPINQGDTQP